MHGPDRILRLAQRIDDPASSKAVGKISAATTPKQGRTGRPSANLHRQRLSGAKNPKGRCSSWRVHSNDVQLEFRPQNMAVRR